VLLFVLTVLATAATDTSLDEDDIETAIPG
jgi:hypothetical protein